MLVKSLSIAAILTLGLTVTQSAFAVTPPALDAQDTCLIGEKVAKGINPVKAMLEALATCDADIETIVEAAITAAPYASAAIVRAAIEASPENAILIVKTAMATAPSEFTSDILAVALEAGVDPTDILEATAAGIEDTTLPTETTETTETTVLPTTTSPISTTGGISAS